MTAKEGVMVLEGCGANQASLKQKNITEMERITAAAGGKDIARKCGSGKAKSLAEVTPEK